MEIFKLIVDNKINVWKRDIVAIEAESLEDAVKKAEIGDYDSTCESYYLSDTEEYLSPDDNYGYPTIDIIDENGNSIWTNSKWFI